MKRLLLTSLLASVLTALPPNTLAGKWHAAFDQRGRGNQYGTRPNNEFVLDLNTDGHTLKGHVRTRAGRREFADKVQDGRIDGNNFSFVTIAKRPRAEHRFSWSGSIENGVIHGHRTAMTATNGQPFTAVR